MVWIYSGIFSVLLTGNGPYNVILRNNVRNYPIELYACDNTSVIGSPSVIDDDGWYIPNVLDYRGSSGTHQVFSEWVATCQDRTLVNYATWLMYQAYIENTDYLPEISYYMTEAKMIDLFSTYVPSYNGAVYGPTYGWFNSSTCTYAWWEPRISPAESRKDNSKKTLAGGTVSGTDISCIGHLLTNSPTATGLGNQRKITRDAYNSKLHMVYLSADKIWYTNSSDQGTTWSAEQRLSSNGIASNPSLASSGVSWGENEIYFTWQETVGSTRNLYFKSTDYSAPVLIDSDPTGSDMQATIAVSDDESKVLIMYKKMYSSNYRVHYKYSTNGGDSFSAGGPLFVGTPIIWDYPSTVWNPQLNKFLVSLSYKYSNSLNIHLLSFNGSTWVYESTVYSSNQAPIAPVYSQIAVDAIGRTHITWIAYDNMYEENSAAMHRSVLNGNWSTIKLLRDEVMYDPSIIYTGVCGHDDTDGGVSLFYSAGNQNTLFNVYSTNSSTWNGTTYIAPTANIYNPTTLDKAPPQSVSYVAAKGASSPFEIKTQVRNNSQTGTFTGTFKVSSANEADGSEFKHVKLYRRIEIVDTVNQGLCAVQFGNISDKRIGFTDTKNTTEELLRSSYLNTVPFILGENDSLLVESQIKCLGWKNNVKLVFELFDPETGKVIKNITDYNLTPEKIEFFNEFKTNKLINQLKSKEASLRIKVDGIELNKFVVNYIDVMIFSDNKDNAKSNKPSLIELTEVPSEYNLAQNYPNPFNPTTTITYQLPRAGNVSVVVYDMLGKEIATLVDQYKTEGSYSVEFNAQNLSSGMYIYEMKVTSTESNFRTIKKMMLIK